MAALGIVALYLSDYVRPPAIPSPTSIASVVSSTRMCLSLAIYPDVIAYWWPAGWIVVALVGATLGLLAIVIVRAPEERPRALGLAAIIVSMVAVAGAVGVSRAGLGPAAILASRYVTLTFPLLCALYIAWLVYGKAAGRVGIHVVLVAAPCAWPCRKANGTAASMVGPCGARRTAGRAGLEGSHTSDLMRRACPGIYPDPVTVRDSFKLLKTARIGAFAEYEDNRVAAAPEPSGAVRR